ncbi:MAG: Wzt carbohydrate-binding domain-containing protein, partial [Planctomycetota bacterium]
TISHYLNALADTSEDGPIGRGGAGGVRVTGVRLLQDGRQVQTVLAGDDLTIEVDYDNGGAKKTGSIVLNIYDEAGTRVTSVDSILTDATFQLDTAGTMACTIRRLPLAMGNYRIALGFDADGAQQDLLHSAATFQVASSAFYETGRCGAPGEVMVYVDHAWTSRQPAETV